MDNNESNTKILKKLDIIISLLQNIIILQGTNIGINKQDLRKIASSAMNKVTNVTKLIKDSELSLERNK